MLIQVTLEITCNNNKQKQNKQKNPRFYVLFSPGSVVADITSYAVCF